MNANILNALRQDAIVVLFKAWMFRLTLTGRFADFLRRRGDFLANEKNLKPFTSEQSREKAVENGRKGGIESGKAKRKRKSLREQLEMLLETGNTQESIAVALVEKAMSGDVRAFEVLRDTIGEKPVDKVVTAEVDPAVIAELERIVLEDDEIGGD